MYYSFVPNCRKGGLNCKFWEKTPQVHLIIIREWLNILSLLYKILIIQPLPHPTLGAFYSPTPPAPSPPVLPTIRHARVLNKIFFLYLKKFHTCLKIKVTFFVLKGFWQPVFGFFNLYLQSISENWSTFLQQLVFVLCCQWH